MYFSSNLTGVMMTIYTNEKVHHCAQMARNKHPQFAQYAPSINVLSLSLTPQRSFYSDCRKLVESL